MENGSRENPMWLNLGRGVVIAFGLSILAGGCANTAPTSALTSLTHGNNPGNTLSCYKDEKRMVRPGLYKVCMVDRGRMRCLQPC